MKNLNTDKQPAEEGLARLLKLAGPRAEPSAEIRDEVYADVHAAWQAKTRRINSVRRWVPAAIAASVIGALAVLLLPQSQQTPVFAGPVGQLDRGGLEVQADGTWRALQLGDDLWGAGLSGGVSVRTGSKARAGVILVNGISVRLDYDTQLQFQTPTRLDLNHGRLYVDTAGQRIDAGLEIVTSAGVVRDIGTQFEVFADASRTRVRVRDGEVILDTAADDFHAGRGEQLAMIAGGAVERSTIASHDAAWNWAFEVGPLFDTNGRLVSELIDWVGRETGREVDYADAMTRNAAASTRILGSVSGQTPEETLDMALSTTRFKYDIDDAVLAIEKHY